MSQARADLSALIEEVRHGESVVITHRGSPVARIEPLTTAESPDRGRFESLVARGLAIPARERIDIEGFLDAPRPKLPDGVFASDFIVEEREESR